MSRNDYDDYARELRDERNDRFGDEFQHAGAEHGKPQLLTVAAAPRTDSFAEPDGCHCLSCEWIGLWKDTMNDRCPNCDSSDVYDNAPEHRQGTPSRDSDGCKREEL